MDSYNFGEKLFFVVLFGKILFFDKFLFSIPIRIVIFLQFFGLNLTHLIIRIQIGKSWKLETLTFFDYYCLGLSRAHR